MSPTVTTSSSTSSASTIPEEFNMLAGSYLHYFDRSAHVGDAPGLYQDIISKATTSVWIFDPYFNDGDEDLFFSLQSNVDIIVLRMHPTGSHCTSPSDCVTHIINAIPTAVKLLGHGNIQCAYIDTHDTTLEPYKFHDRHLIIDGASVYSVGGSIGYQLNPKQSFGIIELEDPFDAAIVIDVFNRYKTEAESNGKSVINNY